MNENDIINGSPKPNRSRPAKQPVHRYPGSNLSIVYFATVHAAGKKAPFASPIVHEIIKDAWRRADNWLVGKYVIMPTHIHFFSAPAKYPEPSFYTWVRYWKRLVSISLKGIESQVFQRNVWETQLRTGESYAEKWNYTRMNPVRKGLVSNPDDWPYQGEMNRIMWHDW